MGAKQHQTDFAASHLALTSGQFGQIIKQIQGILKNKNSSGADAGANAGVQGERRTVIRSTGMGLRKVTVFDDDEMQFND